jgi:uncharacterized membrane protein
MLHSAIKRATATPWRQLLLVLALASAAGLAMLAFRFAYAGTRGYGSLPWDLALAWVPLPLACAVARSQERNRTPRATVLTLGFLWLLFFPNAPYLITQFMHLHPSYAVSDRPHPFFELTPGGRIPLWYDVMMLSTFAWTGLLLGFVSLHLIHSTATRAAGAVCGWATVVAGVSLCAFGVSLGRFERWNSWDLFARPLSLLSDVLDRVLNPIAHPRTSAATIVLSVFLLLSYLSLIALMRLRVPEEPAGSRSTAD